MVWSGQKFSAVVVSASSSFYRPPTAAADLHFGQPPVVVVQPQVAAGRIPAGGGLSGQHLDLRPARVAQHGLAVRARNAIQQRDPLAGGDEL